jgi:CelD/BcsL family acetyltransferase involved in cellulose biosynthesis
MTPAAPHLVRNSPFAARAAQVELIDPRTDQAWDRMIRGAEIASVFNSSAWMRTVSETYGLDIQASVARDATGELEGGIAFAVIDDALGPRVRSLPFSDYCDAIASNPELYVAIVESILDMELPTTLRVLRDEWARQSELFEETGAAMWHGTSVLADADEAWARLGGSSRRNIRRAREGGVTVRVGTTLEDVLQFHEMHTSLRKRKYRMLAQPPTFFEAMHRNFSDDDAIFVLFAETTDGIVAGTLFLEWEGTLYYKFNASVETVLRPNDLLIWAGIECARERGLSFVDFGLSGVDQPGLLRFKAKFANVERRISTLTWRPEISISRGEDLSAVLSGLTDLLTEESVPDDVTARAGALLYRYFA